jgi:hypothetical protein
MYSVWQALGKQLPLQKAIDLRICGESAQILSSLEVGMTLTCSQTSTGTCAMAGYVRGVGPCVSSCAVYMVWLDRGIPVTICPWVASLTCSAQGDPLVTASDCHEVLQSSLGDALSGSFPDDPSCLCFLVVNFAGLRG